MTRRSAGATSTPAPTISTLLKLGAVPIINENDTVATSEIRYGDNDRLAARVATMMNSDLLILLSDVDGLYDRPPGEDPQARFLPVVDRITPEIEAMAGGGGLGTVARRHAHEARRGQDRDAGRHRHVDCVGHPCQPARRRRQGRARHLFQAVGLRRSGATRSGSPASWNRRAA